MQETLQRFKADFFSAMAHPLRIAIIEQLRDGECSAGELIHRLNREQANVSQHLAVLRSKQIVVNRKVGNQVFYMVRDPLITQVLDAMKGYFQRHLTKSVITMKEMGKDVR